MTRAISLLRRAVVLSAFFAAFLTSTFAFADTTPINADYISGYGLRNLDTAIVIHADPATPGAGDKVHLTVESPVYDLAHSQIIWSINGTAAGEDTGLIAVDTLVDDKGTPLDISVTVSNEVWGIAKNELLIVPLQIDILYDAPTYVPPFYRGRSLPSAGGTLRLQAIPRFVVNDQPLKDTDITYTWSRNGRVLSNISGLGRSAVTMDAPALYGTDIISVRASAVNDTLSSVSSITVKDGQPILMLYEDHPLFGIMFHQALPSQITQPDDITVSAIPYFTTITTLADTNLQYHWTLNGALITASSTKRNEVTLRSDQDTARLHLDVTHAINFFLELTGDWIFVFGGAAGAGSGTAGARSDAFHNGQI